jgi:hypothetical protein
MVDVLGLMVDGKIENPLKTLFLRDLYFTSKVNHKTSTTIHHPRKG